MNPITELYRKHVPDDDRSDDAITLELANEFPDAFQQLPGAAADLERIQKAIAEASRPGVLDYAKQAAGSLVRGAADVAASIPEAIAIGAHKLEQVMPMPFSDKEKPIEEYPTMKLAEGIRSAGQKISPEPVEELQKSFLASKVPGGIGSALAFILGGAGAQLLKVPGAVGIAGLGAAAGGVEGYRDAKAKGGTDDQAFQSFLLNAGVGTTEVLPLGRMLKRLEGLSGGTFSKFLARAAGDTIEETLQEALQSGAGDIIAKNIVKYDPDRKLFGSMRDDAAAGGVTGLLFSLLTQGIGHRRGGKGTATEVESPTQPVESPTNEPTSSSADQPAPSIEPAAAYEITPESKARIKELARREVDNDVPQEVAVQIANVYADREAHAIFLAEKASYQQEKRILDAAMAEQPLPETAAEPVSEAAPVGTLVERDGPKVVYESSAGRFFIDFSNPEDVRFGFEDARGIKPGDGGLWSSNPDALFESTGIQVQRADPFPGSNFLRHRLVSLPQELSTQTPDVHTPYEATSVQPAVAQTVDRSAPAVPAPVASSGGSVDVQPSAPAAPAAQTDLDRIIAFYQKERSKVAEQIEVGKTTLTMRKGKDLVHIDLPRRLDFLSRRLDRLRQRKEQGLPAGRQFDVMDLDVENAGAEAFTTVTNADKFTPELGERLTRSAATSSQMSMSKNNTRRLTAFKAPGGQIVVLGTFKQDASLKKKGSSGYQVADPVKPGKSMPMEELMAQGFVPFASARLIDPMNNPVLTYPNAEAYARDWSDAATLVQAARDTTAAVAEQVSKGGSTAETAVDPEAVEVQAQMEDAAAQVSTAPTTANLTIRELKFSLELANELYDTIESIADGKPPTLAHVMQAVDEVANAGGSLAKELGRVMLAIRNTRTDYVEAISRRFQEAYNQSGSRQAFGGVLSLQARQANAGAVVGRQADSGRAPAAGSGATESKAAAVAEAASKTDVAPTDKQKESGRYEKGSFEIEGLEVVIETPMGAIRSGKDPKRPWAVVMPAHYGYVQGTEGKDGDAVDVYIGPDPEAPKVWVIDQIDPRTKKFDEHKAMVGFRSREEAIAAYVGSFSDGSGAQRIGEMTVMPMQDFVDWVNEGVTDQPLAYGRPVKSMKFRQEKAAVDYGATPEQIRSMWLSVLDAARAQGLNVRVLQQRLGENVVGAWSPGQIAIAAADALNPTEDNLVTLLHEVGHEVFAGLSPEIQARLHAALDNITNTAPEISNAEERIVESVALAMTREGFNPGEAHGFAQAVWRFLKDIYLRVVMAIQEARFGVFTDTVARTYLQNRVESYLARDFAAMPVTAYFGGPKHREVSYVQDEFAEPSADVDSAAIASKDVAAHNAVEDSLRAMFNAWTGLGHNTASLTFEQFVQTGNFVQLDRMPADVVAQVNEQLATVNQTVDPATRIPNVPSKSWRQRAAVMAHRQLRGIWTAMNSRRRSAEYALSATNKGNLIDRLNRSNVRLMEITTKYTDADLLVRTARATIERLLGEFRTDTKQIKSLARKAGILTQTIRDLEQRMDQPLARQYEIAINRVWARFSTAEGQQQFSDLLDHVSEVQGIDWENDTSQVIKEKLVNAAMNDARLATVVDASVDSRALLSVLVAFGRSDANVMDFLQLRRSDALADRTAINSALTKAMEDSKDAIAQARAIVGRLPRLARVADRLLTRLEKIKAENRQLLDEIQRERTFIDFHHATAPLLRTEMAKLENIFGASSEEWEPVHGAPYMVPPHPNATIDQVEASTKTLNLNAGGTTTAEVRADMAKMNVWMDGVIPLEKGSTWNTVKMQYDRLAMADINPAHADIQGGWLTRVIGPLTDRLKFVGTPAARACARRLETMQFWQGSLSRRAHELGTKWVATEARARKACDVARIGSFRDMFYRPALSFIEKRQDILAGHPNVTDAENAALRECHAFLMADPETARLLAKPGAWLAVEQYLRATARVSSWLDANRKEMGLKIRDDGPADTLYRESIGAPPFTVLRGVRADMEQLYKSMKGEWQKADFDPAKLADTYRTDPDQLRALFPTDVWRKFVEPICRRTGRSSFYAPVQANGTMPMALRERVIKAFEAAGGDVVAFAEQLFALEGGVGDPAAFVAETISTFGSFFRALNGQYQEAEKANHYGLPVPRRYLMDARKSEEFPAEWLDYLPYDTHMMRQLVKMQSFEKAFGRDMAAMRKDFHTAIEEQEALSQRHGELMSRFPDKKGRGLREAMKAEAARLGWNFEAIERAERNIDTLLKGESQFNAMLKMNSDRPIEIQPWVEILSTMTAATVQGPGTAFTDPISIIEQPFRKFGFSVEALKWAAGAVKDAGAIAYGSLLQAVGRTAWADSQHVKLLYELGLYDDDATTTFKEKMQALSVEETPATGLLKGVVKASRVARAILGTGPSIPWLGIPNRAKPGAEVVYPTVKPHALFTQQAQTAHAASIIRWWKTYEELVGKAVQYFRRHPTDMADPHFEFQPQHLGYKPGFLSGDRGWQYLAESMARYGVSLETEAKSAVERRAVDPNAPLLTREAYRAIAVHGQNEITLETSIATRPPGFITNPVLQMVNPLLGWAVSKSHDAWRSFREPNGERSLTAFKQGLWAYAAILPIGLAYALLRDEYDEEIVGRKQNVMRLSGDDPWLAMLDNLSRVGTFGLAGEAVNSLLNVDTTREFSVDSRVFFVSALLNTQRSVVTWIKQGEADWQTVYRPLMQGLGGSGYLQYAGIVNNALGLDNQEARVANRISVNNYLRAAGRTLDLDVRTGRGMQAIPNPIKPHVGQMILAAYANDPLGFREAHRNAVLAAREEKKPDPDEYVQRSFGAYHPLKLVFRTEPSEEEYRRLLFQLDDDGRQTVSTAIRLFNGYSEQIGAKGSLGKKPKAQTVGAGMRVPGMSGYGVPSLDDARRRAALFGH